MNYIKLINTFYDRLETNSLSTSAIALWHALVHINNKAGWQREFTVAVSVLCIKTGLSERTISNARNELKTKVYIDFKSRKGKQSAIYSLIDLSATIADKVSYNVSDKKELEEDKQPVNVFGFFEAEGFGTISGFTAERLGSLIDDYGEEKVLEAMKEATLHGARNLKYVEAVLKNPDKPTRKGTINGYNNRSNSRKPAAPEQSITGNEVGWIGRRKA
ncbi:DnaD domain protein [Peribacillus sp. B-H-3]|uniref:DnaD domain protein n=1 Tax=Peribacillus sp. B-H-3 TaxID=3400420 RepID=UPI003B01B4EB